MKHASHPDIVVRLKRAHGHLASILTMFADERSCLDLAQQLYAVENAISNAKRELIHDHIEHCLNDSDSPNGMEPRAALREFKALSKYL
ncbi:MAG: metal-sensing transcriptional repressor [Rhodospirillales bacterium]|nr:metal-sensing transcriptional repressor [Rhodospirillales bacterium]